nr:MAG TPA: hypothetical protein [Bacteriophage sp.]
MFNSTWEIWYSNVLYGTVKSSMVQCSLVQ